MMALDYTVGTCPECHEPGRSIGPLHGALGGPACCLQCGMAWYGKHGARRKAGRVVLRAIKAFHKAGGTPTQLKELTLRGEAEALGFGGIFGRMETFCHDVPDLTSELLEDTLRLTHPDLHPRERQALAKRVTAALLEFKPFVFPPPPPEPPPVHDEATPRRPAKPDPVPGTTPAYPCELCEGEWQSRYCSACKAEWRRRQEEKDEAQRQKERAWYRARQARTRWRRRRPCATCGEMFDPKRKDQKHCRAACRQRAHRRRRVTDKNSTTALPEGLVTTGELTEQAMTA